MKILPSVLGALCGALPLCLPAQLSLSQSADAFVDSVGVNVHLTYADTAYNRFEDLVKPKLQSLGIRHIRDGISGYSMASSHAQKINDLHSTLGVKTTLIILRREALSSALVQAGTAITAIEGPNEPDLIGAGIYTNAELISLQNALYTDTKAFNPAILVLPPSFTSREGFANFGEQPSDGGNVHSYPGGGLVDNSLDNNQINAHRVAAAPKPFFATETGYYTRPDYVQGISLEAQAKYLPRLFFEYFRRGVPRTFVYELLDEYSATNILLQGGPESHFGLVRLSGVGTTAIVSDKPVFFALKAMLALLKDPQAVSYSQGALDFRLSGGNKDVRHLLLRKGDGSFWLVIWQNVKNYELPARADLAGASQNLSLEFLQPVSGVTVYEPKPSNAFSSTAAVASASSPASLSLALGDYPLYCKIISSPASPAAPQVVTARQGAGDAMLVSDGTFVQVSAIAHNYEDSRVGDESATAGGFRTVVKFALPPSPPGKVVSTARLSMRYLAKAGAPSHDVTVSGYGSPTDYVTVADWGAQGSLLGTLITQGSAPSTVSLQNTAIRDLLRATYGDEKNLVALRLQLAGGATATGSPAYDFYQVATSRHPNPNYRPTLAITWEDAVVSTAQVVQPEHNGTVVAHSPFTAGGTVWTQYADARIGDENSQTAYRSVYRFTLPALPSGHVVQRAVVRLWRLNLMGTPTHSLKASGFLTSASAISPTDWTLPLAGIDLGQAGTPSSHGTAETRLIATGLIRQAYQNNQTAVGIHLALEGTPGTTGGTGYDFYDLATSRHSNAAFRPVVEILSARP